jgi:lambda repressor-like predicted transcriptional regulator
MELRDHLYSPGYLSQLFQSSVYHVRLIAGELGIAPAQIWDDVERYDGHAFLKLQEYFQSKKAGDNAERTR